MIFFLYKRKAGRRDLSYQEQECSDFLSIASFHTTSECIRYVQIARAPFWSVQKGRQSAPRARMLCPLLSLLKAARRTSPCSFRLVKSATTNFCLEKFSPSKIVYRLPTQHSSLYMPAYNSMQHFMREDIHLNEKICQA